TINIDALLTAVWRAIACPHHKLLILLILAHTSACPPAHGVSGLTRCPTRRLPACAAVLRTPRSGQDAIWLSRPWRLFCSWTPDDAPHDLRRYSRACVERVPQQRGLQHRHLRTAHRRDPPPADLDAHPRGLA